MRNLIMILVVIVALFIVNLFFFSFSDNYKFFIKKIKNPDKVVYVKDEALLDEITISKPELKTGTKTTNARVKSLSNTGGYTKKNSNEKAISSQQILLGEQYQKILNEFSYYNLGKLEILTDERLFDVTDEYPDEYYEYYSKNLTLYLFTTKSYNDIIDIFKIVSATDGSIFSVNESNTFGDKSFFINLKGGLEKEPQVRMVVSIDGLVFGLKFDKDQYNRVKQILTKSKNIL